MVGIILKYNLDFREVARGTQSLDLSEAFSCLCSYSTYDIAKVVLLSCVLCHYLPQRGGTSAAGQGEWGGKTMPISEFLLAP